MDISKITKYFKSELFDFCFGFMIGTIYDFNEHIWKEILYGSIKTIQIGGFIVLTVRTYNEIKKVWFWLYHLMEFSMIIDNTDKFTEYDQWIYLGRKR